jgi:dipeptidyl-peptidase-4
LITGPIVRTWDSDYIAPYYIYDTTKKNLFALADNDPRLLNVTLSPDGKHVAYVLDNKLYVADIETGQAKALITEGNPNLKFSSRGGLKWSPDSKKIAFLRRDSSNVETFHIIDEMPCYNIVHYQKYPEAGSINFLTSLGVVDIETNHIAWMDLGPEPDIYIPRMSWTRSSDILSIQRLNRTSQRLDILFGDPTSGATKIILTETDPCWIDPTNDLIFFQDKDWFTWTSEKSGFRHAYIYDYNGNLITQLTQGEWEVSALAGVDEKAEWVYLYGKKDTPIDQHVYRVKLDGTGFEKISDKPGWYVWNCAPGCRHVIEFFSDAQTPNQVILREANGKMVRILEENRIEAFDNYNMVHPEFLKVKTSDELELNAYMIKPADFDPEKKYPVIVYGFPNAGSQTVVNRWGGTRGLWHRLLTEKGYIIFSIDNRTATGFGKAAKNQTYGHYGKYELIDQIEGAKYLGSLQYVDASRIGFWGKSGGGYSACLLMTKAADYFKTGISVAPVINLVCHQRFGVERWMGLPEDNSKGYEETNLLNYAHLLKGNILLIHGTGDDNVKCSYTLQFANALIAAGKQFDMMLYPNRHHDLRGGNTQLHWYTKMTDYFLKNL